MNDVKKDIIRYITTISCCMSFDSIRAEMAELEKEHVEEGQYDYLKLDAEDYTLEVLGVRKETDEEFEARLRTNMEARINTENREREELARLKAKYE